MNAYFFCWYISTYVKASTKERHIAKGAEFELKQRQYMKTNTQSSQELFSKAVIIVKMMIFNF